MTIKKPNNAAAAPEGEAIPAAAGGATIADRFKLDTTGPVTKKPAGKGTMFALIAALVALAVTGILTAVIYQHWEFLKGA